MRVDARVCDLCLTVGWPHRVVASSSQVVESAHVADFFSNYRNKNMFTPLHAPVIIDAGVTSVVINKGEACLAIQGM